MGQDGGYTSLTAMLKTTSTPTFPQLYHGDCLEVLPHLSAVDAVVTDPPYGLSFMGKDWDHGIPGVVFWEAILAAMKPGAHLLAFGGTRTHHRLMVAIEDAGFEIRDMLMWVYGSGFPKSLDVGKAIDKAAGAEREVVGYREHPTLKDSTKIQRQTSSQYHANNSIRDEWDITAPATEAAQQWNGWGTALKPAYEPIILARKPLEGTVAENVLKYGVGALNIDACRIDLRGDYKSKPNGRPSQTGLGDNYNPELANKPDAQGRWPANLMHDGSPEVLALFPQSSITGNRSARSKAAKVEETNWLESNHESQEYTDSGSAARFFYCPKASNADRGNKTYAELPLFGVEAEKVQNEHPSVKPTELMRYLITLVVPPGGIVLDPFMGSGSTGVACDTERFIGIEKDEIYYKRAISRMTGGDF